MSIENKASISDAHVNVVNAIIHWINKRHPTCRNEFIDPKLLKDLSPIPQYDGVFCGSYDYELYAFKYHGVLVVAKYYKNGEVVINGFRLDI